MAVIKRECIEKVKEIADLYDIVSGYVQLKRSGGNWKGLSPFTVEKTPSFFVLPEKKFFKCFSTGYAGDVFRFLELKENFSFFETVEWLAKRYGITLEYEDRGSKFSKNELLDIHEDAMNYYRKKFLSEIKVRRYWTEERNFSLEAAERYGIGWAPTFDRELILLLKKKGYTSEAFQQCGLLFYSENNKDDFKLRFVGRLMIPIYDVQDRVIGFSGRLIEKRDDLAKYVNSPETPIFSKGNILYGLNHARKFAKDRFIIVEGQLDAMRCWESGLHEAVAPQGTGITEAQMNLLRRYASKILCLTDGDSAGQKCAQRVIELAFKAGMECRITTLGEQDDPDAFLLREGSAGLGRLTQESMVPYLSRVLLPQGVEATAIEKEAFLRKFYEMIHLCDSEVTRRIYLEEIAHNLNLDKNAIAHDFRNFCGDARFAKNPVVTSSANHSATPRSKLRTAEYDLLSLILHQKDIGEKIAEVLDESWIIDTGHGHLLLKILAEIREGTWEGAQSNSLAFSDAELNELFSILAVDEDVEDPMMAANICLRSICTTFAKNKLLEINEKESEHRKFTKSKNLLDDREFFKKLQAERLSLRQLFFSCPQLKS